MFQLYTHLIDVIDTSFFFRNSLFKTYIYYWPAYT